MYHSPTDGYIGCFRTLNLNPKLNFPLKNSPFDVFSISINGNSTHSVIQAKNLGIILDFSLFFLTLNLMYKPMVLMLYFKDLSRIWSFLTASWPGHHHHSPESWHQWREHVGHSSSTLHSVSTAPLALAQGTVDMIQTFSTFLWILSSLITLPLSCSWVPGEGKVLCLEPTVTPDRYIYTWFYSSGSHCLWLSYWCNLQGSNVCLACLHCPEV